MRFVALLATASAYLAIVFVVTVVTDSGIAGFATGTGLLALFLVVKSQGSRTLLERVRNSNLLDERPSMEASERTTGTEPQE